MSTQNAKLCNCAVKVKKENLPNSAAKFFSLIALSCHGLIERKIILSEFVYFALPFICLRNLVPLDVSFLFEPMSNPE